MVHAPWRHGDSVNYNGPKVGSPRRAGVLPLTAAMRRVQLAICWKLRECGGTRELLGGQFVPRGQSAGKAGQTRSGGVGPYLGGPLMPRRRDPPRAQAARILSE